MKGNYYIGFSKKFLGIGLKLSFENPSIAGEDYVLFECILLWLCFWVTFPKKDKRAF